MGKNFKIELHEKCSGYSPEQTIKYLSEFVDNYGDIKLYKFMSGMEEIQEYDGEKIIKNYSLESLKNDELWMNLVLNFNDPFEFYARKISLENLEKMYTEKSEDLDYIANSSGFQSKKEYLDNVYDEIKCDYLGDSTVVSCLSEENKSILMWSHYANNHKGFCIEYSLKDFLDANLIVKPVLYQRELVDILKYESGTLSQNVGLEQFYTKSIDWEYEKEWRIVHNAESNSGVSIKIPQATAIFLGCKIESALKEQLLIIAKEKRIPCYQSVKDRYEYKLNFIDVNV